MKFQELSKEDQEKAMTEVRKRTADNTDIDLNEIQIEETSTDRTIVTYKDIQLDLPIGRPSQETTDKIALLFAGAAIALVGVILGRKG